MPQIRPQCIPWINALIGAFLVSFATTSHAYDIDTHFYETYRMARYTGIGHEVAAKLATLSQWIDVSAWNSPMSPVPVAASRMRRLNHFHVELGRTYSDISPTEHGSRLQIIGETKPNSLLSNEMFALGLKMGILEYVGAGLHHLMDSFGHAGFGHIVGHGLAAHHPDRPWLELAKHKRMTRVAFQAFVAVRETLRQDAPWALDETYLDGSGPPHTLLTAEELYEKYNANSDIQDVMARDIFREPEYVQHAVRYVIEVAQKHHLVRSHFNVEPYIQAVEWHTGGRDTREALAWTLLEFFRLPEAHIDQQLFDLARVRQAILPHLNIGLAQTSPFAMQDFINDIVDKLTSRLVPLPLNDEHKLEIESNVLHRKEMEIRLRDAVALNKRLFGVHLQFTHIKLREHWRLNKKPDALPSHEPELEMGEVATLTPTEQIRWMGLMWKYQFGDLFVGKTRWHPHPDNKLYQYELTRLLNEGALRLPLVQREFQSNACRLAFQDSDREIR